MAFAVTHNYLSQFTGPHLAPHISPPAHTTHSPKFRPDLCIPRSGSTFPLLPWPGHTPSSPSQLSRQTKSDPSLQPQVKDNLVMPMRGSLSWGGLVPTGHMPRSQDWVMHRLACPPGTRTGPDIDWALVKYSLNDCRVYLFFHFLQFLRTFNSRNLK